MSRQMGGGWTSGRIDFGGETYNYMALAFDTGSEYGINEGRVSKLFIKRETGSWGAAVYQFDRGLGEDEDGNPVTVDAETQKLVDAVLARIG